MDSKYTIISYCSDYTGKFNWLEDFHQTRERFEALVNSKLQDGYMPTGGICIERSANEDGTVYRFSQALIRAKNPVVRKKKTDTKPAA